MSRRPRCSGGSARPCRSWLARHLAHVLVRRPVHFVQIWIVPDRAGYAPRYGQIHVENADKKGRLRLVASPDGAEGSLAIRQDARIYESVLETGTGTSFALAKGRHFWVQALRGSVEVNGKTLSAGDGLSASDETAFAFKAPKGETEFLVFDLK